MERPARKTKNVNYFESVDVDNDDEDFVSVKPPPGKKLKQQEHHNTSSQKATQEIHKSRKALDEKLLSRDLEAAITLSLLDSSNTEGRKEAPPAGQADENTDPASLHRSNCSVDTSLLGLDEISKEKQRRCPRDDDNDYEPKLTPDSASEEDLSEDEEFTMKSKRQKKEQRDQRKPHKRPDGERRPPKLKAQPRTACAAPSTPTLRSPPMLKAAVSKPPISVSPTGARIPKWNPPGQIGKSPPSSQSPTARSPGQGLRLGLSRRVRVKPLHPSSAAT
ncbi:RAD51-associated protein 1 [Syngnathus scovelli]|uniref:RAD51-associated protein 1 n=1 Tax=Syngnathus scovelli TaxID=161590 RepID=UPI00210FD734|nr:RAD51-associated protein 1 [Syngnathus scovelli]